MLKIPNGTIFHKEDFSIPCKNVSITINKLFYYENEKQLQLQLGFSKYLKVQNENTLGNQGPSFSEYMKKC